MSCFAWWIEASLVARCRLFRWPSPSSFRQRGMASKWASSSCSLVSPSWSTLSRWERRQSSLSGSQLISPSQSITHSSGSTSIWLLHIWLSHSSSYTSTSLTMCIQICTISVIGPCLWAVLSWQFCQRCAERDQMLKWQLVGKRRVIKRRPTECNGM